MRFQRLLCAIAIAFFFLVASTMPARAEGRWLRAESDHFIVYAAMSEERLRGIAERLERFDAMLRLLTQTTTPPSAQKLEIYLLNSRSALRAVMPGASEGIRGFYTATPEIIASFGIYQDVGGADAQEVLFHEYAHHFQLFAAWNYPAWYREGFAEFVQTMRFENNRVTIGLYSDARAAWAGSTSQWMPVRQLLDGSGRRNAWFFYAQSWITVHYLQASTERQRQFREYLIALNRGGDPIKSFEPAFGMPLEDFERDLRRYARGSIVAFVIELQAATPPAISITRMPDFADDLLLPVTRMRLGVREQDVEDLAERVERIAARHPSDRFALLARVRALIIRDAYAEARTVLEPLIAAEPNDPEAQYLMGDAFVHEGWSEAAGENAPALVASARRHFARAFRLNPNHVPTLYHYAMSYADEDGRLPTQALEVLLQAQEIAPQVAAISANAAYSLAHEGHYAQAAAMLRPFLNSAHGDASNYLRRLLEAAERNEPPPPQDEAEEEEGAADTPPETPSPDTPPPETPPPN